MRKNVFVMVRQEGQPSLFLTFSPSESTWIDLLKNLYKLRYAKTLSEDELHTCESAVLTENLAFYIKYVKFLNHKSIFYKII